MRRVVAAALTLGFAGSAFGESDFDEIQDEEQPGSEIGIQIGGGTISVERENGAPSFPIAPYAAPAPVFPSAPYVAPTPVFPSAPYTAPAPIFPVAPLATRGGQLRPLATQTRRWRAIPSTASCRAKGQRICQALTTTIRFRTDRF